MSKERESITWKVKKTWEIRGQPFGRDEKLLGEQEGCPLISPDFYYVEKMKVFVQW